MSKGAIIIGYQGIGKSTLANDENCFIDLESSCFWYTDEETKQPCRWGNWAEIYTNIAVDLAKQNNIVFTSSHQVVRDELARKTNIENTTIAVCVPTINIKDEWIEKLKNRYERSGLDKDYKAWKNAEDRYEENINEIISDAEKYGWIIYFITDINYYLSDLILDK